MMCALRAAVPILMEPGRFALVYRDLIILKSSLWLGPIQQNEGQ